MRDTQDTAYVIFAVVIGMAVGANDLSVSVIGIGVVILAAFAMIRTRRSITASQLACVLGVRLGLGHDLDSLLGGVLDAHLQDRELLSVVTARQGLALDLTYETRLRADGSPNAMVQALNRVEGVQNVQFHRRGFEAT